MKNKKIVGLFVICFVVLAALFVVNLSKSFAASTTTLPATMTSKALDPVGNMVGLFSTAEHDLNNAAKYLVDDSGQEYVSYCLEHEKNWGTGLTYTKSQTALDPGYAYIMLNGAPVKSLTGDSKTDIYLTQVAIWLYQDLRDGKGINTNGTLYSDNKQKIINSSYYTSYIKPLVDGALVAKQNGGIHPNPTFTVNSSSFKYQKIGGIDYLVTDKIDVSSDVDFNTYKVSLNISNYEILDENNTVVSKVQSSSSVTNTTITKGKGFKIRIPLNQTLSTNTITMSMLVNYTQYEAYLYTPPSGYSTYQQVSTNTLQPSAQTYSLNKSITLPLGNLVIKKVDSKGNNLQGAKLIVTNDNGYSSGEFTTSTTPKTLTNLVPGTYKITEISAPTGYVVASSANVTVTTSGTTTSTMTDDDIELTIRKVDAENPNKIVENAVIGIFKPTDMNNPIYSFTTGAEARVITGILEEGTYYVKETAPAPGYILDPTPVKVTITGESSKISVTLQNLQNETEIIKVDENNNQLSGVTLALYKKVTSGTDTFIERWTTNGRPHSIRKLEAGDYYVKEVAVPEGYILSDSVSNFHINENQTDTQTVTFTNTKKGVVINKVDAVTGVPVPNAVLKVVGPNGYNKTFTSGLTPIVLEGLAVGNYTVTEERAPDGYIRNTNSYHFEVKEDTKNISVRIPNEKNTLSIAKVDDDTGTYLAGASFELRNSTGELIDSWSSDEGVHKVSSVNLKHGTYTLVETEAPTGYILDSTPMSITIDQNSDNTYIYKKKNKKMNINVIKLDEDGNYLDGVTLALYDENDNPVKTWQTRKVPETLDNLTEGSYYVKEIATKAGYILDTKKYPLVIDSNTKNITVTIRNVPISVEFAKIDAKTNKLISGAKLKLSRQDGSMDPITWTTENTKKVIKKLAVGTYILEEVEPAPGYVNNGNKVVFEVKNTGKVQTVNMKDNYITLSINNKKLSVDTNGEAGFKFELTKLSGEKVEEWTSTSSVHTTAALTNGDYILTEKEVPSGFIKNAVPYKFTITDQTSSEVKLINTPTTVHVSKKDFTNGKEIPGAKLILKNSAGEKVDEWISTSEPHLISALPVGKYRLTEILAPDNYVLSTETVEFEVKNTGNIQATQMYNEPEVKVEDTAADNPKILYIISLILVISGFGVTLYTVKRKA